MTEHAPGHISVGAYFWGRQSEKVHTGQNREQQDAHRAQSIGDTGGTLALDERH